jgi:phosphoribosylaminoimidazole-succinocarboxamide synthase
MRKDSIRFIDKRTPLYEGAKKIVFDGNDYNTSLLYFKDSWPIADDAPQTIPEKGVINNALSSYIFEKLNVYGLQTHHILKQNGREQLVQNLEMIPAHIHIYNVAPPHVAKPLGLSEGVLLPTAVVDWFVKDDQKTKSMMNPQHFEALGIVSSDEVNDINTMALRVNHLLTGFYAALGLQLNEVYLRFGRRYNEIIDDTEIMLGDEISLDTCFIVDILTNKKLGFAGIDREVPDSQHCYRDFLSRCPFDLLSSGSNPLPSNADVVNLKANIKEAAHNGH